MNFLVGVCRWAYNFFVLLAEFSVLALWGVMGWRCDKVLN